MKKEYKKQFCLVCGKELIKKIGESVKRYEKRKYCCMEHMYKDLKEKKVGFFDYKG